MKFGLPHNSQGNFRNKKQKLNKSTEIKKHESDQRKPSETVTYFFTVPIFCRILQRVHVTYLHLIITQSSFHIKNSIFAPIHPLFSQPSHPRKIESISFPSRPAGTQHKLTQLEIQMRRIHLRKTYPFVV